MRETTLEIAAEAAYVAAMNLRSDKKQPMHPWATLPEYWKRIYRAQGAVVIALLSADEPSLFGLGDIA